MRALLVTVLLLAAPASAAAKPLDADRGFASNGIFRLDDPYTSSSVIALRDGGTLHATDQGLMRLSAGGSLRGFTPAEGGGVTELVRGLAVGTGPADYGEPTPLMTWPLAADGTPGAAQTIALPAGALPVRVVRRRGGYAVLVWAGGDRRMLVVALTGEGALDTAWGEDGVRKLPGAGYDDLALAAGRDGSVVFAGTSETRCERGDYRRRKERAVLVVRRFAPTGALARTRRIAIGRREQCPAADTGDAIVDSRGRVLVAARFGAGAKLLRLRRDLTRDRGFTARIRRDAGWWLPARLERRPGGGYAVGFTSSVRSVPRATVALVSARGRVVAARRLKVTRRYPTSDLHDIVFDRRNRLIAAGSLRDTDAYIREDYGAPHLAVWRLRTR